MARAGEDSFAVLRSLEAFRFLTDEDLQSLARVCRRERHEGGTVIFREGDESDTIYFVAEGEVEIWKGHGGPDGEKLTVLERGKVFGEMALVEGESRSATVVAGSPVTLLAAKAEDFQAVMHSIPALVRAVQRLLVTRVRRSTDRFLEDLKRKNENLEQALADLRRAQDELVSRERLSTIGRFASYILHDLRKPVTTVQGYTELLLNRNDLPPAARDYAEEILRNSRILDDMAREMLDYSKGDIHLDIHACGIPDFMGEIERILKGMVISREIEVETACAFPGAFPLDRDRMIRVFYNLADNAVRAMGRKGKMTVSAERSGEGLAFSFSDTGVGMDHESLERIFEPFFSSEQGGTGLGMVAVRNVIEAHGGTITVSSASGKGTTFTISLPPQKA
jgi:signal transduction histidine kinase